MFYGQVFQGYFWGLMDKFFRVTFEMLCPSFPSLFLGSGSFSKLFETFLPRLFGGVDDCFLKTSYLLLPLVWLFWCVWVNCCHFSPYWSFLSTRADFSQPAKLQP